MHVIGHQAIAPDLHIVLGRKNVEKAEIAPPVLIRKENILPAISSLSNMVGNIRHNNASDSNHTGYLYFIIRGTDTVTLIMVSVPRIILVLLILQIWDIRSPAADEGWDV